MTTALPLLFTGEQAGLGTVTRSRRCYPEGCQPVPGGISSAAAAAQWLGAEQTQPLCTLQSQRRPAASGLPMAEPLRAQAAETAAVRFAGLSCLLQLTGLTQTDKLRVRPD